MKHAILLALLCASLLSYANDIIVTTDNQKLEVKITAVTREAITYKMPDYLDGPDFTLETSGINSIIFENGQVKTYNHTTATQTAGTITTTTTTTTNHTVTKQPIKRVGNTYYCDGKEMPGRVFSNEEYTTFLKNNNTSAYNLFSRGTIIAASGYGCLIGGGICMTVGTIAGVIPGGAGSVELISLFIAGYTVGSLAIAAGIPLTAVGYSKMHKSADVYNVSINKSQAKLHLGLSADQYGLGLALRF